MPNKQPSWEEEFDKEFDWRELQYDKVMYVPTKFVKAFISLTIQSALDEVEKLPKEKKDIEYTMSSPPESEIHFNQGYNQCLADIKESIKKIKEKFL